jgi:uncharacterized protein
MKKIFLVLLSALGASVSTAQVQVRPLPASGYENRIKEFIDNVRVVDTHEHLMSPANLKKRTALDFMLLLHGYSDFRTAGLSNMGLLLKDSLSPNQKWQIIKPYWDGVSNTAYNRISLLTADKLFNVKDINESTVTELSEKIAKAYESPDWIDKVIEKCKIDFVVEDNLILESENQRFGSERFRYVKRFDNFININSKQKISFIASQRNVNIQTLDALVEALATSFKTAVEQEIVAIKIGLAYMRILHFEEVTKEKAEEAFNTIMNMDERMLSFADVKPLQDYMMRRVLDQAKLYKIPVQIHTGFQQYGNFIGNSNPTHLVNLFREYPSVNFVLFHGSYPYGGELSAIAKAFGNVYLDLTWVYVLSPSFSLRYLHEWLETIPASKITGFGGDYANVENAYGHLLFARQIIARVLIEKVKDGYFSEAEAKNIGRLILRDNAIKLYKLSPSERKFPEQLYYKVP